MNADKVRSYFETATNLVVLVVVTLIAAIFAWGVIQQQSPLNVWDGLQKGKTFTAVPSVTFGSTSRTLIFAMNSKCGHCNESIPFYRQVIDVARRNNNVQMVFISSEEENLFKDYLSQARLKVSSRSPVDLASYGIASTPTIIMVDNEGRIIDFWVGKLSHESEEQLIKAVSVGGINKESE